MTIFCAVFLEEIRPELACPGEFGECVIARLWALLSPARLTLASSQPLYPGWLWLWLWAGRLTGQGSAHCVCMTTPHFPGSLPQLPRLDTRPHKHPSRAYHCFPSCRMFTWDPVQRAQAAAFSRLDRVIGEQKWSPASSATAVWQLVSL